MERSSSAAGSREHRVARPPAAPLHTTRRRVTAVLPWLALALVVALGAVLRIGQAPEVRKRGPDEVIYTYFSVTIANRGLGVTRDLFRDYESDTSNWSYPVPTRITYVLANALTMRLMKERGLLSGVITSCLFSIASLLVLAWLARRFFGPWVAVTAVLLLAFQSDELSIAARAWVDAAFACFGLLLLLAAGGIASGGRWPWQAGFMLTATLLLLTKQTAVVGYVPCVIALAWILARRGDRGGLAWLLGGAVVSVAATVAIWGALAGGVTVALSALMHSLHPSALGRAYVATFSTGPWFRFPYTLWRVGPTSTTLALAGGLMVMLGRERVLEAPAARVAGIALLLVTSYVAFASVVPGMQNLRYICPADGALAMLAALGLALPLRWLQRRWAGLRSGLVTTAAALLLVVGLAHEYQVFASRLLRIGDVPVRNVLDALGPP
jgi:hypothetical protein